MRSYIFWLFGEFTYASSMCLFWFLQSCCCCYCRHWCDSISLLPVLNQVANSKLNFQMFVICVTKTCTKIKHTCLLMGHFGTTIQPFDVCNFAHTHTHTKRHNRAFGVDVDACLWQQPNHKLIVAHLHVIRLDFNFIKVYAFYRYCLFLSTSQQTYTFS